MIIRSFGQDSNHHITSYVVVYSAVRWSNLHYVVLWTLS